MPVSDQGIDKETSNGIKVGELPLYYLVSAVLTKDEDNKIIAKPSTVRPIINTVIAIDDVGSKAAIKLKQGEDGKANGIDANNESIQVYITDAAGRLCNFDTGIPSKRATLYNFLNKGYGGWVGSYTRADNVMVHVAKYVVPENRILVIEQEFGAHLSGPHHEMFVLQDEDSDWVQRIEVTKGLSSPQTELKSDGWVRLQFEDIPKKGTFSLYSVAMDKQSSPVVHFNAQTTEDLKEEKVVDDLQTAASDAEELEDDDNAIAMNEFDSWLDDWAAAI